MTAPWTNVSGTLWTRPPGEIETAIKLIELSKASHGVSEISLTSSAKLKLDDRSLDAESIAVLRRAWVRLRFDQPSLASTLVGLDKVSYEVPDTQQVLDEWIANTLFVADDVENVEALNAAIPLSEYVCLHVLPRSSQVVLYSSHWRSDGVGMIMLMERFLQFVAEDEDASFSWGEEIARLAPPAEDAAKLRTEVSADELERIKQSAPGTLKLEPALCIKNPVGPSDAPPKQARKLRSTWSKAETETLVAACRTRNISVTTAIHSALAICNRAQARDTDKELPFRCTIRSNIRPKMPAPFDGPAYALTPIHAATSVMLDAQASYEDGLRFLDHNYKKGYDMFEIHRPYYRYLLDLIFSGKVTKIAESADVDISSLGIIEKFLRPSHESRHRVTVEDFICSTNIYSTQCYLFVWTFQDQLSLYISYNEAYYTEDQMQTFLRQIHDLVVARLGSAA